VVLVLFVLIIAGLFFARMADTLVRPGDHIGKIAGAEPLAHRQSGNLLSP